MVLKSFLFTNIVQNLDQIYSVLDGLKIREQCPVWGRVNYREQSLGGIAEMRESPYPQK